MPSPFQVAPSGEGRPGQISMRAEITVLRTRYGHAMPDHPQEALLRLLDLQEQDTAIQRLETRRAALPEAAELADTRRRLEELDSDADIAEKQRQELSRAQSKLEGEIELIEIKTKKDSERVFSGAVSNPKELSALQSGIEQQNQQRSVLEDQLLEVMEQVESNDSHIDRLTTQKVEATERATELEEKVSLLMGDIDAELESHGLEREKIVPDIPSDLLAMYDKLREQKGGVGAAPLRAGTCEGCHTKIPQRELEHMKAQKGLQRCENCRRILVVLDI